MRRMFTRSPIRKKTTNASRPNVFALGTVMASASAPKERTASNQAPAIDCLRADLIFISPDRHVRFFFRNELQQGGLPFARGSDAGLERREDFLRLFDAAGPCPQAVGDLAVVAGELLGA